MTNKQITPINNGSGAEGLGVTIILIMIY